MKNAKKTTWFIINSHDMVINLISSPRNISTAMMYSFASRSATIVVDEPFYAYYLNLTGVVHPGREEIIQSQPTDHVEVINDINNLDKDNTTVFVKNMAHHLIKMDIEFLKEWRNVFLIRQPDELIASFAKVISEPKMNDIGVKRQREIFDFLLESQSCPIIDSNEVLKNPEKVLSKLCEALNIDFQGNMLKWEKGNRPEDGVWGKYWYKSLHETTGFGIPNNNKNPLPAHCLELYNQSLPYYDSLFNRSIKA